MEIKWTPALEIGHEVIDRQHIELFSLFDQFVKGCSQGRGKESLVELHNSLNDYVESHFREEEALMERIGYPELSKHKREHQKFRRDMLELSTAITSQGISLMELVQTNKILVNWLVNHVQDVDQRLGTYLRNPT